MIFDLSILRKIFILSMILTLAYGCNKGDRAPFIAEIKPHILVPVDSHSGLWLGPGMFFKPGDPPHNFHIFISESDRKGKDSVQRRHYFTVDSIPAKEEDFSEWWKTWKEQPFPSELTSRHDDDGYEWVPGFTWKYHRKSDKWLGIGVLLRHKDKQLANHLEHVAITYSLFRDSEKIIFPNNGIPIGNFHVYNVSPRESWVAVPEWDRSGRDIPCDILLGRII